MSFRAWHAAAMVLAIGAASARAQQAPPLTVTSSAFDDGGAIPKQYTCDGKGTAPPLSWSAPPQGTRSIAVLVEDPDAPSGTFDHLAAYNVPPSQRSLPTAAIASLAQTGSALTSARNSGGTTGFAPICPPSGRHHYRFTVVALDEVLPLQSAASASDVKAAMEGHVLARGTLVGTYASR